MTNKKLKMAAMSVALTACVAASPLAANADAPEAAPEKKEPVAEETKKEENTAEPQDNKQAENAQETLKGAEVEYNKEHPTTNPDGSQKLDGVIVTNPEGSGETGGETNPNPDSGETNPNPNPEGGETNPNPNPDGGETDPDPNPEGGETNPNPDPEGGKTDPDPNPNPDSGKTDPEEKKLEEKKPEEKEPEEKKPEQIGTAEKTEKSETNVETKPNPGAEPIVDTTTPPTVEKNPDGSTTITQPTVTPGKETTTTTGTGEATGNLHEKKEEVPKKDINLDKELGKNPDISWNIEKGADAVNGYKVEEVTNSDDGNKQTLKLKKEEETTAEMTAEDIAKLVDAEKPTVNPDGTYTLTRTETILDAEGNPQTRTTYITIRDNKVTTKTTTELTITRKKAEQDGGESFRDEVTYPSIQIKGDDDAVVETISPEDLEKMLNQGTAADDGIHFTKDDKEYVIQETTQPGGTPLSNAEIVDRLKKDGNKNYELGADGEIYYTTPHDETVKLDVTQNQLLRQSLTYKVTLTTTKKGEKETAGEQIATEKAKKDAIQNALTNAVERLDVDDDTKAKLKDKINPDELNLNGGTFEVKLEDGKTYTLTYTDPTTSEDPSKVTVLPDEPGKTDIKEHTVTGSALVTNGKVSWTDTTGTGTYQEVTGNAGAGIPTLPEGAVGKYEQGRLVGFDVVTTDKDGHKVTTTYTITYSTLTLTDTEKEDLAWEALRKDHPGKTKDELIAEGYKNVRFEGDVTKAEWTVTQKTEYTKEDTETLNKVLVAESSDNFTFSGENNSILTVDGKEYTKGADGKYTRTEKDSDNKTTTTYTVTLTEGEPDKETIKSMLAKQFSIAADGITLNDDGTTATYTDTDGKSTVTIDYSKLKKTTLTIDKSVDESVQKTVDTRVEGALDSAYEEFWADIQKKRKALKEDERLWVGHIQVTETTIKEEIITYLKTAVTQADMTTDQIIAALNAQKELAKKTKVTVNEGTRFEETLDNYYSGKENFSHAYTPKLDIIGYTKGDYIRHLDLASDAQLNLLPGADGTSQTTDCVLVNPKLEWNYSAEDLLADKNNTNVGLDNKISYDEATGEEKGHFEYERGDNNNHPKASAFYKVTGKVAYGKLYDKYEATPTGGFWGDEYTEEDYAAARGRAEAALAQYKKEYPDAQVVEICEDQNEYGGRYYQIYLYQSDLTAYGYMTRDANVCTNATAYKQIDSTKYFGGYDLMISKLVQTKEGKVVGENQSSIKTLFAPISVRSSSTKTKSSMTVGTKTTSTPVKEEAPARHGTQTNGEYKYDVDRKEEQIMEQSGTGKGHYKSFTNLIRNIFNGDGTGTKEGGFIKYVYHSEKDKEGNPVPFEAEQMVVTTKQDAEVHYTFTSQESRDVWIKGYTQTVVPPVNPGPDAPELPPVEDAKPAPAPAPAPEAPVLPVVQDARPDPAPAPAPAPETPVLPAVQDAKLIQTGTSGWLADLMLGAGMVLSAAGYWMERKRKAMFYKSQH